MVIVEKKEKKDCFWTLLGFVVVIENIVFEAVLTHLGLLNGNFCYTLFHKKKY